MSSRRRSMYNRSRSAEDITMDGDLQVGDWRVQPRLNALSRSGRTLRVEPKVMEVLVYLARRPGEVVSRETLIRDLWGDTFVTDAALTRCIAELRKVFDDDAREPRYIETIAKSGYRLIAPVTAELDTPAAVHPDTLETTNRRSTALLISVAAAGLLLGSAVTFVALRRAPQPLRLPVRAALPLGGETLAVLDDFHEGRTFNVSPDGSRVAYVGARDGKRRLFVRALDTGAVTAVLDSD